MIQRTRTDRHRSDDFGVGSKSNKSMKYTTLVSSIAALMLVIACGQDAAEPVSSPPGTTVPDTTQVTAETETTQATDELPEETSVTTAVDGTVETGTPTEPVDSAECPEGQHSHDGKDCHPDETLNDTSLDEADMVVSAPKVVLEEEWWRPGLSVDAVALTDPTSTGADRWHRYDSYQAVPGSHPYDVYYFFHYQDTDKDYQKRVRREETIFYQILLGTRKLLLDTDWAYLPYRYDLSWSEYPTTVHLVAAYPLGQEVEMLVSHDGLKWDLPEQVDGPAAPPIRPTNPFAEPRWADTATQLGRDCPPVEDIWQRNRTVGDPCTLEAIHNALTWVWAAPSDLRQRAIRDGHVLAEMFHQMDTTEDLVVYAAYSEQARVGGTVETKEVS